MPGKLGNAALAIGPGPEPGSWPGGVPVHFILANTHPKPSTVPWRPRKTGGCPEHPSRRDVCHAGCLLYPFPEGNTTVIHFRVPRTSTEHRLVVYAARIGEDSDSTTFQAACSFNVVGALARSRHLESCFPKISQRNFADHGFGFVDKLPCGVLRADQEGNIRVTLTLQSDSHVRASLRHL